MKEYVSIVSDLVHVAVQATGLVRLITPFYFQSFFLGNSMVLGWNKKKTENSEMLRERECD